MPMTSGLSVSRKRVVSTSKADLTPANPLSAKQYCRTYQLIDYVEALIAGVDEVGRGPLIGNVVAAAVILPPEHGIVGLKDSKKIAEKKRILLSEEIKQKAIAWAIAYATPVEIDQINILQASLLAMTRAIEALDTQPEFALIDGNKIPEVNCPSRAVVKGDSWVEEISAASILAKVSRDQEMQELDKQYPQYGFAQHKGYPTAQHMDSLKKHGVLSEHRKSFGPVKKAIDVGLSV